MASAFEEFVERAPQERRAAIRRLCQTIRDNINPGFTESFQYGMPTWSVPHSIYPKGYHCKPSEPIPFISVANTKGHIGLHAFCIYTENKLKEWLILAAREQGITLDMGKGCIRFKKPESIPYELVGQLVQKVDVDSFVAIYSAMDPRNRPAR